MAGSASKGARCGGAEMVDKGEAECALTGVRHVFNKGEAECALTAYRQVGIAGKFENRAMNGTFSLSLHADVG